VTPAQEAGPIQRMATLRGQGGLVASAVAAGAEPGSELVYASYMYFGDTLEVTSVDPATGRVVVYGNPAKGEYGARCMTAGPDGNVYLGTLPTAHLLQLETRTGRLLDLGRPSKTEEYIWDVAFGGDGRLYGATYPNAKLIRFDPKTGVMEDLGRMDESEMYAHYVAAGAHNFVYVGIGTRKMNIVAYDTTTGEHRAILPASARQTGQAIVFTASDRVVYGIAGERHFRLDGWTAVPVEPRSMPPRLAQNRTADGRTLALGASAVTTSDPSTGRSTTTTFSYPGRPLPIFRIGTGPDGKLYGSSVLPARLFRLDEGRGELETLGDLGPGEVYSFLSGQGRLLMGAYACAAPLMAYDPTLPFKPDADRGNPKLVGYARSEQSWRPGALTWGPDGRAYAGATAAYGRLEGQLVAWDVATGTVERLAGIPSDQGISAIATAGSALVLGTTINGGGGTTPARTDASLLLWDTKTARVLKALAPIPGAPTVESLLALPTGRILGIAGGRLFALDPAAWRVTSTSRLPFSGPTVFGALATDANGRVWGLAEGPSGGVFSIDAASLDVRLVAHSPKPITAGLVLRGMDLFFGSGPDLYRFRLPPPRG
jgi:outer membrane protein assembly factor BamB